MSSTQGDRSPAQAQSTMTRFPFILEDLVNSVRACCDGNATVEVTISGDAFDGLRRELGEHYGSQQIGSDPLKGIELDGVKIYRMKA
jgi:hypothetical protein